MRIRKQLLLPLGLFSLISQIITAQAATNLSLSWTNNLLTVTGPELPGGKLEIWYLEAFCRKNSTHREWGKTTLPHKTSLMASEPHHLRFRTTVEPKVEVMHEVQGESDNVRFDFILTNNGPEPVDLEWFQPACIRVERFTGANQSNYVSRSFIFTDGGLTTLDKTGRREEAVYRGGQVYVPRGINLEDVNPRPLASIPPTNGLIGCFSRDGKHLLATASSQTQELFEGVYVCLHSDPRVGGLAPGETKRIHARLYILKNDPDELLKRYVKDFAK